jgi:hypothetical protein
MVRCNGGWVHNIEQRPEKASIAANWRLFRSVDYDWDRRLR